MKKLFGTDGIRGLVFSEVSPNLAYKVGKTLAIYTQNLSVKKILVAGDTRNSTDILKYSLISGIASHGVDVVDIGIAPTPVVSYLSQNGFAFGVMITASHNPCEFNGIKIFDCLGNKLNDKDIEKFNFYFKNISDYGYQSFEKLGKIVYTPAFVNDYEEKMISNLNTTLNDKKIVLDCSNGACSHLASRVFEKLGATVKAFNTSYDGLNVNEKCGALHPEFLKKTLLACGYDIGFAFDGDGDRVLCVLNDGTILDGDALLFVLARYLKMLNQLYGDTIVTTTLTNCGVENSLKQFGIKMERVDVGDKNVSIRLQEKKYALGGEKAGHIIFSEFCKSGDAIYIAGLLLTLEKLCGIKICEILKDCVFYPCVEKNIPVSNAVKNKILSLGCVKQSLEQAQNELFDKGRLVVRASGTEPKIRLLVEGYDENLNKKILDFVEERILKAQKII